MFFIIGLGAVIYSAEKLVEGVIGTSLKFGVPAFLITLLFIGFDPENLATGAAGAFEKVHGIAFGSIIGSAMVAVGLAFGITALLTEIKFKKVSKIALICPILTSLFLFVLSMDGIISRLDGLLLLSGFVIAVVYFINHREKVEIEPEGELEGPLEEAKELGRLRLIFILSLSLAGIILGSEILVSGAKTLIQFLRISDALFGMTILAFLVSIEELARELPAAMKGRFDISYGNVVGSILHFFLLNAGIIALINPIKITPISLNFYFPLVIATIGSISLVLLKKKEIPKWMGAILILFYLSFILGGYYLG